MNKEEILNKLQKHWNAAARFYNEERFLGIFKDETNNQKSIVIIIPSFDDFCLKPRLIANKIDLDDGDTIEIKDIRLVRMLLMKQDLTFLNLLYTDNFILNPKYESLFKIYFINNRESISHYDKDKFLLNITKQIYLILKQNYTDQKIYDARKLYYLLESYCKDLPYKDCLEYKVEYETVYNKEFVADQLKEKTKKLRNKNLYTQEPSDKAAAALDEGTVEIIRSSFQETKLEEDIISKEDFIKSLTNTEVKAYYSIIKEIGIEGNIAISKLINKNNISRPVYNNLINKLKECKIATVTNMGMKGIYIKILHPDLKAEAIDFS